MKKFILLFYFFGITLATFAQSSFQYPTSNLNLRSSPSTEGKILKVIPKGSSLVVNDGVLLENWAKIEFEGAVGYVHKSYLSSKPASQKTVRTNSAVKFYTNTKGEKTQSPTHYNSQPSGATAICKDGTYSFSRSRRGTCSGHGGVSRWL